MKTTAPPRPPDEKPRRVRPPRANARTVVVPVKEPVSEPVADETIRIVGGLRVIADEPVTTNLPRPTGAPPIQLKGYTKITLEDHTVLYACAACDYTGQRGEVMRHRAEKHGAGMGGRRKGTAYSAAPKPDYSAAMEMTLGEVLELAVDVNNFGTIIEALTADRDDLRRRLMESEQEVRKYRGAFDRLGFVPRDGE